MPTVVTRTLAAGWQLRASWARICSVHPNHGWVVASYIVVGVMAVLALGLLEPANIAVLFELKKPRPNPEVIERLMKRFIYCAGILGVMQIATLVIMTKLGGVDDRAQAPARSPRSGMASLALIVAGGIYLSAHLPQHVPLGPAIALLVALGVAAGCQHVLAEARPGLRLGPVLRGGEVVAAGLRDHRRPDLYAFLAGPRQRRAARHPDPLAVVFAVQVPALIGFTVARYDDRDEPSRQPADPAIPASNAGLERGRPTLTLSV